MIQVSCKNQDCSFLSNKTSCSHADKKYHLGEDICPLYRPDWNKASKEQINKLKERFNIGKKVI